MLNNMAFLCSTVSSLFTQSTQEKTDQDRWLVKHAYFQPREGARVSLYSDSHHDPGTRVLSETLWLALAHLRSSEAWNALRQEHALLQPAVMCSVMVIQ